MTRREFLAAAAATTGACMCGGTAALAQTSSSDPTAKHLQQKIDFMQKRMARLLGALDAPTRARVLETMGRECAKEFSGLIDRFRGKPQEFLEEAKRQWMESASYDETTGEIRVVDRATACTCAFVQPGLTPPDFCACTLGWQKEAYSAILGEPVDAELDSSILRGANRCAFHIRPVRSGGAQPASCS